MAQKKDKIRIAENEEKKDIKFPALLNYEEILYTPQQLEDINKNEGNKLNTAINDDGQVITDLINTKLNTQTKQILSDFTFGTFGAIKIITDSNNGIWISPTGILGKKAGATTFSLTDTGDATFKGTVVAGSVIACDISADNITTGTLTGRTIQTAASGKRIVMETEGDYINDLLIYSDTQLELGIFGNTIGSFPNNTALMFKSSEVLTIEWSVPLADVTQLNIERIPDGSS